MRTLIELLLTTVLVVVAVYADAAPYYVNDFESSDVTLWSTTGANTPGIDMTPSGRHFLGSNDALNLGFSNEAVTLSLASLPAHSAFSLSFDLFVIQSWDGNGDDPPVWGIDVFDVSVGNGDTLLHTTFRNVPFQSQAFPGTYADALTHDAFAPRSGAVENNTLGYPLDCVEPLQCSHYGDAVYHLSFSGNHSATDLLFSFSGIGLQDIADES